MFDGSASDGHGFGQQIEPLLRGLEHSFIRSPPYAGKPVRFGCLAATYGPDSLPNFMFDNIIKQDLATGEVAFFNPGNSLTSSGKMVLTPCRNAAAEDDGWVIGRWWHADRDKTEFVIADAQAMSHGPAARLVCDAGRYF